MKTDLEKFKELVKWFNELIFGTSVEKSNDIGEYIGLKRPKRARTKSGKYKEDDLFGLPEEGDGINTNQMTWSNVQEGVVNIAPGDTISDPQLGNLKFKGGDSSNLENYDFIGFPE